MLIKNIVAHSSELDLDGYTLDYLALEWYELSKRIQRKTTRGGEELALKFVGESSMLRDGDVLVLDTEKKLAILVELLETEIIILSPKNMLEMATICYEIGNKHMPLFIEGDNLLLPYEAPMFKWLEGAGYEPKKAQGKLVNRLKSGVSDHQHIIEQDHSESLFTKVINFAAKKSQ